MMQSWVTHLPTPVRTVGATGIHFRSRPIYHLPTPVVVGRSKETVED
jgi:hypothetical protein